jgi:DNA-binding MarR family transcriptional regulator
MVAYRSLAEMAANEPSWFRYLSAFDSKVRIGKRSVPRFERTGEILPEIRLHTRADLARIIVDELPAGRTAMPDAMVNHVKAFAALLAVDHARRCATVRYVSEATGLSQATTSVTLAGLRACGLVSGNAAMADARETILSLTPRGARARQYTRKRKREAGGGNGSEEGEALTQEAEQGQEGREEGEAPSKGGTGAA